MSVSNFISNLQLISWPHCWWKSWWEESVSNCISYYSNTRFFFSVHKILINISTCPKTKVGARKVSSTASSIWKESLWSKLFSLSQELHLQTKVYIQHQSWACSWKEDKTLVFDIQYFFSTAFLGSLTNVLTLRRHVSISTKNKGEWKKGKLTHFSNRSLAYRENMHGDKTGAKDWFFWIYISKAAFLLHTSMNICTG